MKIDDPKLNDDLTKGLRRLNALAKILKQRRRENGFVLIFGLNFFTNIGYTLDFNCLLTNGLILIAC